jgi:hypothetical protein
MRKNLLLLFWLVSLAGRPATTRAQLPAASPDAALACRQARLGPAARTAAAAGVPVRHRLKMDRYDVQFYRLDLTLDNTSRNLAGSALLRVRVGAQPLDSLAFELYQAPPGSPAGTATLVIDSVVAEGRRSPGVLRQGQAATAALALPAPAGTVLNTRIYYHGTAPSGSSSAIGNAFNTATSYRRDNVDYPYNVTWSLSEPFSAHEWFPCKQVLTDKADSSAVFVTTTLPNKVGSNGVLARTVLLPGGRVRYEWHENHPIDYYLISVAVAPYVEYVTAASPLGGPRVPIVNYVYDQASLTHYQADIDRTAGFLENYSQLFGLYYFADEKYGHAMAPIGGGMEHQTMTTLQDFSFTLVAHELAHQWFGDNVTCASWEDVWLNESFASYGEYLSLQAFDTPASARAWMDDAQTRAQNNLTGTVRVPDTTNVGRIFNYNLTYKKGATVVHLLRYLCHDDSRFFRVLRTYQSQLSRRTAHTLDLQRYFEAELGQPLDYFFQQWYRGEGFPTFAVRWNQVGSTLFLQVNEMASVPASTPFFQTEVEYQLTLLDGSTRTVRLSQTQPSQGFSLPITGTVTNIAVDPNGWLPDLPGTVLRDNALVLAARAAVVPTLALYPNPTHERLTISGLATAATAEICDATGRVVQRQPLPLASPLVSTQALAPGLYMLRVLSPTGEALGSGRFVKE